MVSSGHFQKLGWLARLILFAIPSKKKSIAITLHHVGEDHINWLADLLDDLSKTHTFLDPQNYGNDIKRSKTSILLTFDDGFKSNRIIAEKVLNTRNIKAFFFITKNFIGLEGKEAIQFARENFFKGNQPLPKYSGEFDAMCSDDIHWLINHGHVIGGHTNNHPQLNLLTTEQKNHEIVVSSDELQKFLNLPINTFAYPFGSLESVDIESINLAQKRFRFAFSNVRGCLEESPSSHFFYRQNIITGTPSWMVKAIINGKFDFIYRSKRKYILKILGSNGILE